MSNRDRWILVGLVLYACLIWVRDVTWWERACDVLPILSTFPLFVYLGSPWVLSKGSECLPVSFVYGLCFFLFGVGMDLTFLLALSWVCCLYGWLRTRVEKKRLCNLMQLMVFPLFGFPWVTLDLQSVGWWFRYTAAWATAAVFSLTDLPVLQRGTNVAVGHLSISVDAACSGLYSLQSFFICGSLAAFLCVPQGVRFWVNLLSLPLIAWVANTLRVMLLALTAFWVGPEFALGPFHTIGGWGVLVAMFGVCWLFFSAQTKKGGAFRSI